MHTEKNSDMPTALRTCPRCGEPFRSFIRAYLCELCKQVKKSVRKVEGKELTFREKQIVQLVYQAKLNKEIAYELHLSEGTIKEYLYRIFRKIGVKNRTDLALWGLAHREIAV